ncbi:sigma-70 family RNA polymerase sigma factor [Lachnoanaerobaculum sp. Marseille-Q4761]|jgi:RNA polymerase sigma factor, sigma-70 family|uniref:sigma-70 family RNA polymerase sigma factor n=1 Tax=Lachnoanaerobaculum sp. Marseille-Q4761 TaxID=2819511 RepID=UPI001AA17FBE|nr:sigma-70 family RNA polymerase sigma factor [Lachnoanaerobaculum sp. Marseille-Q4761]MBO1872110.1 sigma-70 family RNA polymerase sigma factor [Lachnoanaerobaculum sp. Marseille-Q4761]
MAEKYIYVEGKKIYVSDEVYREYKKHKNHESYLQRLDRKNRVYSLEEYADSGDIADESIDIEKIVEMKMRMEDLYKALDKLNDKEKEVIYSIYFEEKTLKDVAKEQDTNLMKISRIRDRILKKLREMLS